MLSRTGRRAVHVVIGVLALGTGGAAQALPWVQYVDPINQVFVGGMGISYPYSFLNIALCIGLLTAARL